MTKTEARSLSLAPLELGRLVGPLNRATPGRTGSARTRLLVAFVLALIAGCAVGRLVWIDDRASLPAGAVFRLDGSVFNEQQLDQRATLLSFLYGVTKPDSTAGADRFNRALAKAVAVSMIVEKAAQDRGIVIADKVASDKLERMILGSGTSRRTFIQQLGSRGLSESDILDEIKFEQSNAELFSQITQGVAPTTDASAKTYFDTHRKEMASPEYRSLVNIVVPSKGQAQQIARLARTGRSFSGLVASYSIDGSTRSKGGSLGRVTADQLEKAYAAAAFAVPRGAVFGPVKTPQGWNVGRVTSVQAPRPLKFAAIKNALKARLDYDARLAAWNTFLTDLVKKADLTYAPAYQPANADEVPTQAVSPAMPGEEGAH